MADDYQREEDPALRQCNNGIMRDKSVPRDNNLKDANGNLGRDDIINDGNFNDYDDYYDNNKYHNEYNDSTKAACSAQPTLCR